MEVLHHLLINIVSLTTGRRIFALNDVLAAAKTLGDADMIAVIGEALAHEEQTVALEQQWARSRRISKARGRSVAVNQQMNRIHGALHGTLASAIAALPEENSVRTASQTILNQLYPQGAHPIVILPFEEQLVANDTIVSRLTGDLASEAWEASIYHFVEQLSTLNNQFRGELERRAPKEVEFSVLAAARRRGNLFLRRIIAIALGTYHQEDDASRAALNDLVTPILDQCRRVQNARKGRRTPPDVDPVTGRELVSEEETA